MSSTGAPDAAKAATEETKCEEGAGIPVIIDTDPGVDDTMALLLALAVPEKLRVVGITVCMGNHNDMGACINVVPRDVCDTHM